MSMQDEKITEVVRIMSANSTDDTFRAVFNRLVELVQERSRVENAMVGVVESITLHVLSYGERELAMILENKCKTYSWWIKAAECMANRLSEE